MRVRYLLAIVCVLMLLVAAGGCSSGEPAQDSAPAPAEQDEQAQEADRGAMLTGQFETWLEENYGEEAWYMQVNGISYMTRLRKPCVLVFTAMDSTMASAVLNEPANEWANSETGSELLVRWITIDGMVIQGGVPLSVEFAEDVPAPPASANEFMTWLDSAFGPASGDPVDEDWYGRITGAGPGAHGTAIEVTTDLDYEEPADREQADVIGHVLQLARPAGATEWSVTFEDGENVLASTFQ